MRKMISFKIENLPDKERKIVDEWADGQKNINQSLANIVMHVVNLTGNTDVMDFDVQRKLHTIFVDKESPAMPVAQQQVDPQPTQVESRPPVKDNDVISKAVDLFEEE